MTRRNGGDAVPVLFGEVLFDHFPDGSRVLGGAPFNVAWHLRGFGRSPLLVTAVGDDRAGRAVLRRMEAHGLATDGVQIDLRHPTGRVMATVVDGEPSFEIASGQAYDFVKPNVAAPLADREVSLVYHGTLGIRSDPAWSALRRLRQIAGAPSLVDLNLRDPWWTPDRVRWCLGSATWLKLSETELAEVTGRPSGKPDACVEGARDLAEAHGLSGVFVTRGEAGAVAVVQGRVHAAPAHPVPPTELVDTVGAGDGFSAVACLGLLAGWEPETLLTRAMGFAADLCRVRGAIVSDPSLYERHRTAWREP